METPGAPAGVRCRPPRPSLRGCLLGTPSCPSLRRGEAIEITKRGQPIGRLTGIPAKPQQPPDFVARARRILGAKTVDAVELIRYGR